MVTEKISQGESGFDLFTSFYEKISHSLYLYSPFKIPLSGGIIEISRSPDFNIGTVEIVNHWGIKDPVRFGLDPRGLLYFRRGGKDTYRASAKSDISFAEQDVPVMKWVLDCAAQGKYITIPEDILKKTKAK